MEGGGGENKESHNINRSLASSEKFVLRRVRGRNLSNKGGRERNEKETRRKMQ